MATQRVSLPRQARPADFNGLIRSDGTAFSAIKVNLAATQGPTANDDASAGYSVGSRWIDVAADQEYVCLDATNGAANWRNLTTHQHAASDITSGVLPFARGGLGLNSAGAGAMLYASALDQLAALPAGSPGGFLRTDWATGLPAWGDDSNDVPDTAPTIIDVVSGNTPGSNTTSHVITMPSNIQVGDLIVIFFATDGTQPCRIASNNWTKAENERNSQVTGAVFYKFAESTSESATVNTGGAEQSTHIVYQIRLSNGWTRVLTAAANGNSGNANPPNLDFGGTASGLMIVARMGDSQEVASGAPTGYSDLQTQVALNTGAASTNTAVKFVTDASSEDPGAFSGDGVEQWVAFTCLITNLPWNAGRIESNGSTGENDNSYGTTAWTNPGNALYSDNTNAVFNSSGFTVSNFLKVTGYNLGIPAGATILSIRVILEGNRSGGSSGNIVDDTLKLTLNGSPVGNNLASATTWPTGGNSAREYGGDPSLWGVSLTAEDLNDSTFGVVFAAAGNTVGTDRNLLIDRITIRVAYFYAKNQPETFSADSITSGVLPVPRGGTGLGSYTANNYLRALDSSTLEQRTPAEVLSDIGAAAASHSHSADDVTSGTLPVVRGGTGLATVAANRLLGTGGSADAVQAVTIGSGLSLSAGVLSATGGGIDGAGSASGDPFAYWDDADTLAYDASIRRIGSGQLQATEVVVSSTSGVDTAGIDLYLSRNNAIVARFSTSTTYLYNVKEYGSSGGVLYRYTSGGQIHEVHHLSSSRASKRNIREMEDVRDKLRALRPSRYEGTAPEGWAEAFGLIAEEVEEIFPDLILTFDRPDGSEPGKTVAYDRIPVYLLKGWQAHEADINDLVRRIQALEALNGTGTGTIAEDLRPT